MNIGVLYFDRFGEQETGLILNGFKDENIIAVALENRVYITEGKQKVIPDTTIDKLNPEEVDLFIIPDGDIRDLFDNLNLRKFLNELNQKGKYIAGLSGGSILMAEYGILKNKKCRWVKRSSEFRCLFKNSFIVDRDVVIDDNIITATSQAFIECAVELYRIMDIFDNEEELMKEYRWLKNIKS